MPTNQAQWQQFLTALQQWGSILKQEQNAPNVLPAQFQTFPTAAATATIAALTAVNCTPTIDATQQYYGAASLKVVPSVVGATLAFTGFPVPIESASKWFCAFQVYAPSGMTGALTVQTSGGTTITEDFTIPAGVEFQQVWGLFDFSADPDPTCTWQFTFTSLVDVWIDGMQMSIIGDNVINLPAFSAQQMITGPLAYVTNLDGIPDGTTYARTLADYLSSGRPFNYLGAWSSVTAYNIGDEVTFAGNYYLAIAPGTNEAPTTIAFWQILGPTNLDSVANGTTYSRVLAAYVALGIAYNYQGAYSHATAYPQGAEVSSGGNYYLAVAATTGHDPPNPSFWQLLGPTTLDDVADGTTYARVLAAYLQSGVPYNFKGAWSSATAYNKGDEVSSAGNYYLATAPGTNHVPPNASFWQLLGPTSLQTIADGTTRFAQQIYPFGIPVSGVSEWVHVGTLILNQASSASFYWSTGVGYNTNLNQQSTAEVVIRASNNTSAPNLSGINVLSTGASEPILAFKAAATGGSTSPTNASWELYCDCAAFTYGPLEVVVNQSNGDSFVFDGAVSSDPGAASTTVVVGNTSSGLNPVLGSGLDALPDGSTYSRTLGAYVVGGVPFVYRGTWLSATAYVIGDEVSFNGSYYIAIAPSTNQPVTGTAFWVLVSTPVQWITSGNCIVNDTSAVKQGGVAALDSSVYSAIGYPVCHIAAKANQAGSTAPIFIGLSTTPAAATTLANANFAWDSDNSGATWGGFEAGALAFTTTIVSSPTDVAWISYDGTNVKYFLNDPTTPVHTTSAPGLALFGYCPFRNPGSAMNSLDFGPGTALVVQDTPQLGANAATTTYFFASNTASYVITGGGTGDNPFAFLSGTNAPKFNCTVIITVQLQIAISALNGATGITLCVAYDDTGSGSSFQFGTAKVPLTTTPTTYAIQFQFSHSAANPNFLAGLSIFCASVGGTLPTFSGGPSTVQTEFIRR